MTRSWWHIRSCDSASPGRRMYVLTFTCLVLPAALPSAASGMDRSRTFSAGLFFFFFWFIPMLSSHLRGGNAHTIVYLLYNNKAMGSQRHFIPVSPFLLPCRCMSSLQPISLFCLWPFSRFPWCLCSLKSSTVSSATCSIANTSKRLKL